MGHKILHRKQKNKQWATRYYTENKIINNGPQNTTQKTKILTMSHKILHRKQKYKQWATQYYTENNKYKQWATRYYTENKNINNGPQNTTQKTKK
jgi:hypothetical protein